MGNDNSKSQGNKQTAEHFRHTYGFSLRLHFKNHLLCLLYHIQPEQIGEDGN